MKKLLITFTLALLPVLAWGQFLKMAIHETDSIVLTSADSTTYNKTFYTLQPWSVQFNYGDFDSIAATSAADLYVYCSGSVQDSTLFDLLWVDNNLDGVNDNPWELSSSLSATSSWTVWGVAFPFYKLHVEVERDSVSSGCKLFFTMTRSRDEVKK